MEIMMKLFLNTCCHHHLILVEKTFLTLVASKRLFIKLVLQHLLIAIGVTSLHVPFQVCFINPHEGTEIAVHPKLLSVVADLVRPETTWTGRGVVTLVTLVGLDLQVNSSDVLLHVLLL